MAQSASDFTNFPGLSTTIVGRSYLSASVTEHLKSSPKSSKRDKDKFLLADVVSEELVKSSSSNFDILRASLDDLIHFEDGILTDFLALNPLLMQLQENFFLGYSYGAKPIKISLINNGEDGLKIVVSGMFNELIVNSYLSSVSCDSFPHIPEMININGAENYLINVLFSDYLSYEKRPLLNLNLVLRYVDNDSVKAKYDCYDLRRRIFSAVLNENIDKVDYFSAVKLKENFIYFQSDLKCLFLQLLASPYFSAPDVHFDQPQSLYDNLPGKLIFESVAIDMAPGLARHADVMRRQNVASLENEISFLNIIEMLLEDHNDNIFWKNENNIQGLCLSLLGSCQYFYDDNNSESSELTASSNYVEKIKEIQQDVNVFYGSNIDIKKIVLELKQHLFLQLENQVKYYKSLELFSRKATWESIKVVLRSTNIDMIFFLYGKVLGVHNLHSFASKFRAALGVMVHWQDMFEFARSNSDFIMFPPEQVENIKALLMSMSSLKWPPIDNSFLGPRFDYVEPISFKELCEKTLFPLLQDLYIAVAELRADYIEAYGKRIFFRLFGNKDYNSLTYNEKYSMFSQLLIPPLCFYAWRFSYKRIAKPKMFFQSEIKTEMALQTRLQKTYYTIFNHSVLRELLLDAATEELAGYQYMTLENLLHYFKNIVALCRNSGEFVDYFDEAGELLIQKLFLRLENSIDDTVEDEVVYNRDQHLLYQAQVIRSYYLSQWLIEGDAIYLNNSLCSILGSSIEIAIINNILTRSFSNDDCWENEIKRIEHQIEVATARAAPDKKYLLNACVWMAVLTKKIMLTDDQVNLVHMKINLALKGVGVDLPDFIINGFEVRQLPKQIIYATASTHLFYESVPSAVIEDCVNGQAATEEELILSADCNC